MERVLVALSGGVDSSVAAALLKKKGYRVAGAIMRMGGITDEEVKAAETVAEHLTIPFFSIDFRKRFERDIIQYFIDEYREGRTPNPCVICNESIKFGLFLKEARKRGYDKVATGHYAGIEKKGHQYILLQGVEKNEQSYFLYRLQQTQLAQVILPLHTLSKAEVRKKAGSFGLPSALRQKSQDVCFIPDNDYVTYLRNYVGEKPGPILDRDDRIIGTHKGIHCYTYGQRRGIGISSRHPLYVTRIDKSQNAVHVGERADVYKKELIASKVHFITSEYLTSSREIFAKPRYVSPLTPATITPVGKTRVKVFFKKSQWALTPGQSVVFYDNGEVLGGGIIDVISK